MAGGEPRLGTTATYMRHYDHGTTHLSTEIDRLHDRINDEYRVFSAGSVRKWSKFGLAFGKEQDHAVRLACRDDEAAVRQLLEGDLPLLEVIRRFVAPLYSELERENP